MASTFDTKRASTISTAIKKYGSGIATPLFSNVGALRADHCTSNSPFGAKPLVIQRIFWGCALFPHADLGAVVSSHPVDNLTRRRVGGCATGLGVIAFMIGVSSWFDGEPPSAIGSTAMMLGCSALTIGTVLLFRAFRGGAKEGFTVHVDGLSHTNRFRTQCWRWKEIAFIRVRRPRRHDHFAEYFGTDVHGAIHPRTSRAVRFDGMTCGYEALISAVNEQCDPVPPLTLWERARWLLVTMGALGAAVLLFLVAPLVVRDGGTMILTILGGGACLATACVGIIKALQRG